MIKEIVKPNSQNTINFNTITELPRKGIIAQVGLITKTISVLVNYRCEFNDCDYAFLGNDGFNTATKGIVKCLERVLDYGNKIYYFDDWNEFSCFVVNNNLK